MKIIFKKSYGGTGVTIDERNGGIPEITLKNGSALVEGVDFTVEEKDKLGISEIVFEWMNNQSVFFQK